jgi:hypothetical protein
VIATGTLGVDGGTDHCCMETSYGCMVFDYSCFETQPLSHDCILNRALIITCANRLKRRVMLKGVSMLSVT